MALIDDMKAALRVTDEMFDSEVPILIEAAIADMARVGVEPSMLEDPEELPPLPKMAVYAYCKAHFGFDNTDKQHFQRVYTQTVRDLLNSKANVMARGGSE